MVEKCGYTVNKDGHLNNIDLDDQPIFQTLEESNNYGLYVQDNILYYNGIPVAKSQEDYGLGITEHCDFNSLDISTIHKTCINITLEDYNTLLRGEVPAGYKAYDRRDVYNIVSDVNEAASISYTVIEEKATKDTVEVVNETITPVTREETTTYYQFNVGGNIIKWPHIVNSIYNNIVGIDTTNEAAPYTLEKMLVTEHPYVDVRYFNPVIANESSITLNCRVDDYYQSSLNYNELKGPFTIRVTSESGEVTTKSVYAGMTQITTPVFSLSAGEDYKETWFSIDVVGTNGITSPLQYFDVYIKRNISPNYYTATNNDLLANDISFDVNTEFLSTEDIQLLGYRNKIGFSTLFASIKDRGYNGIILPKHVYYIGYNRNISSNQNTVNLGTQTYYYAEVNSSGTITKVENRTYLQIEQDYDALYRYYEYPSSSFANFNTIYEESEKEPDMTTSKAIVYIGDDNWNKLSSKERTAIKNQGLCLATHARDRVVVGDASNILSRMLPKGDNIRGFYFVINTEKPAYVNIMTQRKYGLLEFPNHFTVDLNGSTWLAAPTYGLGREQCDLVMFTNNVDSHLINGKIKGLFENYNFLKASLAQGISPPCEHNHVVRTYCSSYCSYENLDISGSLGYDCVMSSTGIFGGMDFNVPIEHSYINTSGNIITESSQIGEADMIVFEETINDSVRSFFNYNTNKRYITFGRHSSNGYGQMGYRPEVFMSFYDSEDNFISTIKTKAYYMVIPPANTHHIKITGYGKWDPSGNTASGWTTYPSGTNRGAIVVMHPEITKGIEVKNCFWHDTRTIAFGNTQGRQILFDNNYYKRIATDRYLSVGAAGNITPMLADAEDSWQFSKYITIRNCTAFQDSNWVSKRKAVIYNTEGLNFINNNGLSLQQYGGVEAGIVANNTGGSEWEINRTRSCFHPQVEMRDNSFGTVTIDNKDYLDSNRTDYGEDIEKTISIDYLMSDNHQGYKYFNLRKCKFRDIKVERHYL